MTSIARPLFRAGWYPRGSPAVTFIDSSTLRRSPWRRIEPQCRVDIAGVAGLDVEVPAKVSTLLIDMNSLSRSGNNDSGKPGAIQRFDLRADHRLVLAEAGVDQHRRVALREKIAVRHRIAPRARGIGADRGRRARTDSAARRACPWRERGNSAGKPLVSQASERRGLRQTDMAQTYRAWSSKGREQGSRLGRAAESACHRVFAPALRLRALRSRSGGSSSLFRRARLVVLRGPRCRSPACLRAIVARHCEG